MSPHEWRSWAQAVVTDPRVLGVLMRQARDRDRATEAIDEAVSRCSPEVQEKFESYDYFRNWVSLVARNYLVDEGRRKARERPLLTDVPLPAGGDDPADQERRELARRAVEALEGEDRELVRAYFLEGRTYEQLAEERGRSITTVWKRMRRPLALVRQWLLTADPALFACLETNRAPRDLVVSGEDAEQTEGGHGRAEGA